ncbi:MAG: type II secretion system protein GspL [Chromatiales bacterium]|nr:type II secretion system protein GspL [Chromatiales bacterium]
MNQHLVIRIPEDEHLPLEWVRLDAAGGLLDGPVRSGLAELRDDIVATGLRVTVLLPATTVLRISPELPAAGRSRLLQMLPFALEDQLAEDIDELHFAAGSRSPRDGSVPVAVIRRTHLAELLQRLQEAGIHPHAVVAETDGLPEIPGTALLYVDQAQNRFLLRQASGPLVTAELDLLGSLLTPGFVAGQAPEAGDTQPPPPNLVVYADGEFESAPWRSTELHLASLDEHVMAQGLLPRLAAQVVSGPAVNLLQGGFARRSGLAMHWPRWRPAAALAAGVLVAALLVNAVEAWHLTRQSAALERVVEEAFRQTFPDERQIRDVRAQLESRRRALGRQPEAASRQFLDSLDVLALALGETSSVRLEAINYRSGSMELRLLAPDVASLDSVRQRVTAAGRFQAEIQSANAVGDQVQGRMRITSGGA